MKKLLLAAATLLACVTPPVHAWVELEASYWFMKPSGQIALGIDGLEGTSVDVQDDLGYGSQVGVPDVRLIVGKYVEVGAEYFRFNLSAEHTIQRDVRFHDLVFPVSADVASSLEATFVRGFVRLNIGPETLHGGIFGGGQYMDFSAAASSSAIGATSKDVQTGMPYVGAFLEASPVDWLGLHGSICGFKSNFGGITAQFVDVEAGVSLQFDWFYAGGGYRYINIKGEDNSYPVTADLQLSGPEIFAGVRF